MDNATVGIRSALAQRIVSLPDGLGKSYFECILDDSWVFRQIDSVRIANEGITRRHTSLDVVASDRLPGWPHDLHHREQTQSELAMPVALIKKGVIDRLDVSIGGNSVPVLTTEQNTEAALAMLFHVIREIKKEAEGLSSTAEIDLEKMCIAAVSQDSAQTDADQTPRLSNGDVDITENINRAILNAEFSDRGISLLYHLARLTETLSKHFMLIAVAPAQVRQRRILVKYSLDFSLVPEFEPLAHAFRGKRLAYRPTTFFESCSYHFELDLPAGLRIVRAAKDYRPVELTEAKSRIHLTWPGLPAEELTNSRISRYPIVHLQIAAGARGPRFYAGAAAVFTLLFASVALYELFLDGIISDEFRIPSPFASIILTIHALLLSWTARTPENNVVAVTLKTPRAFLAVEAGILFSAALLLAVPMNYWVWFTGWVAIFVASAFVCVGYAVWRHANPLNPPRVRARAYDVETNPSPERGTTRG